MRLRPAALVLACASCVLVLRAAQPPAPPPPTALVDVVALDEKGRPVLDLGPADFQVTIDGQPREVRAARYVFRGAGAQEAARGALTRVPAAAVPGRLVLIAIDEHTVRPGAEKAIVAGVWRVVEGLTPADLVGVLLLPSPRGNTELAQDHEPLRAAMRGLRGRVEVGPAPGGIAESMPDLGRPRAEGLGPEGSRPVADPQDAGASPPPRPVREDPEPEDAPRVDSFDVLAAALAGWRDAGDARTVVYVTGGSEPRASGQRTAATVDRLPALVDAAARARTRIHVVHVAAGDLPRPGDRWLRLATATGATTSVVSAKRSDTGALATALSGGYALEVERLSGDRADRPVDLRVQASRKGVRLLAASRWVAREDPLPEPVAEAPAPPLAALTGAPAPRAPARDARPRLPDPELDAVLARVGQYVETYLREFGNVIAEESYVQTLTRFSARTSRRTRADLLLLKGADGWVPFRDVFEVDGQPLRERDERLKALFLEDPDEALAKGRRISEEGARYNLGGVYRTINTPLVTISFFHTVNLRNFEFERRGTPTVDGTRAWRIGYREVGSPTQITQATTGADLPSKGAIWVEPASGRVLRTSLETGDIGVQVLVTVDYAPNDTLGFWVPEKMEEVYRQPTRNHTIAATARYSRFRRFAVSTDEMLGPPR